MRKITKQKKSKKPIVISILAIAVVLVGGYGLFQYLQQHDQQLPADAGTRPVNTVDYNPPSAAEKQTDEQQKTDIITKDNPSAPNPAPSPATTSAITVTISRAGQANPGEPLNIRTIVSGITIGTCTATFQKDGQTSFSKTFSIGTAATYATCQNADIATSTFPVGGDWTMSIVATKDQQQSAAVTKTVTIVK